MAKTSKADAARRGTKADPARAAERRAEEERREKAEQAKAEAHAGGRELWYVEPLDPRNLPEREVTTRRLFTAVEVVLCLVPVLAIAYLVMTAEFDFDALILLVFSDTTNLITVLVGLLQLYAAYLVHSFYERYLVGDVGPVQNGLMFILCSEIILQNYIGIVGLAVALWRVWKRCKRGNSEWQAQTTFKEKFFALLGPVVFLFLAIACVLLESYLS